MKPYPRVVFICAANLCRSLMAQAICVAELRRRNLIAEVRSAGMYNFEGNPAAIDAKACCERHGTPLVNLVSTYYQSIDLGSATRILVMTRQHAEMLSQAMSDSSDRIQLLGQFDPKQRPEDIADPIGQSSLVFDDCYARLQECINHYLDTAPEWR